MAAAVHSFFITDTVRIGLSKILAKKRSLVVMGSLVGRWNHSPRNRIIGRVLLKAYHG
jgi:hypothetical protein